MTKVNELVFVGFNSRVAAIDKYSGKKFWSWRAKGHMSGFVALLLDGERLYISVDGYTTCLDALTGKERWHNPLKGMGVGAPCLAMTGAHTSMALMAEEEARRRTTTSGTHAGTH